MKSYPRVGLALLLLALILRSLCSYSRISLFLWSTYVGVTNGEDVIASNAFFTLKFGSISLLALYLLAALYGFSLISLILVALN